jgi:ABC-type transport system involved in multi-copper enzyme maturation permease subunit
MTEERTMQPAGDDRPSADIEMVDLERTPSSTVETSSVLPPPAATPGRRPSVRRSTGGLFAGLSAVGVKELRGRMRGRRAFVVLTVYLLLLAGFAWMYELILEQQYKSSASGTAAFASAAIGQELFAGLMMVVTLLVVLLAPAFTAGAISLEREKQTLDLLVTTPISSLSIVVGKLFSALTYVFILIGASVPLTAVVFVFGGVAPDDVIRGYIVLVATAIGLGSFGIFCSSIVKRTQAATVITTFGVMAMTLGSIFILYFWGVMAQPRLGQATSGLGPIKGRPPQAVAYLNPFMAQADVVCGTQTTYGAWCARFSSLINGNQGVIVFSDAPPSRPSMPVVVEDDRFIELAPDEMFEGAVGDVRVRPAINLPAAPVAAAAQPFGVARDAFWPRSVASWLVLSVVFIALSIQLVSPTRRWRLGLRRGSRRNV